jgi:hypothetical protein
MYKSRHISHTSFPHKRSLLVPHVSNKKMEETLPLWIRFLAFAHRVLFATLLHPQCVLSILQLLLVMFAFLYLNRTQMIQYVDTKVTEYVLALLSQNVFPESEKVTLKRVKFRWNRVDAFDIYVGNCVSSACDEEEEEDENVGSLSDEAAKEEKKEKGENAKKTKKTKTEFSSPYFMRVKQISFRCSFFTLVPMMQFMPDKNFAVGFLSAKVDSMEFRGVDVFVEEWRGRGNFRVFKKKGTTSSSVKLSKSSSSEEEAKEDEAATTKGTNATGMRGEEEDASNAKNNNNGLFSYFQSQVQTQIEDANKKIQEAANRTIEISGSVVKEIGAVATDVTDKLTALGRYATMINTVQEDPIEMMQKRPLVLRVKETKLIDWNVKILTVSQTSFKVKQFEMVDKVFVGTGKAFGKRIAQGVLQRIIVEFQDESLNLITNGVSDGFMMSKKFLDDGFTTVYDGVKKTTESGAKMAAKTMESARSSFTVRTVGRGEVDPHELTPTGSVTTTSSHLGGDDDDDDDDVSEKESKDSVKYELFPDKDPHEMQQQKSAASASDLFGLGNLFSTCSPRGTTSGRKNKTPPPPSPLPSSSSSKSTTLGKPESPPQS